MERFSGQTYALLRIVAGLLFLWHGMQKLFGYPAAAPDVPGFILYWAGPIELIGGILVLIGLFTRQVAFVCSGLMAAAYWMAHASKGFFPLLNGGELAVLYCFVFLFLASKGSGMWSVDAVRGGKT